jgi:hypothetical protein
MEPRVTVTISWVLLVDQCKSKKVPIDYASRIHSTGARQIAMVAATPIVTAGLERREMVPPANSLHQQRMRSPGRLPDECGCCPFLIICRHMTVATYRRQHHFDSIPFSPPSDDRSIDRSIDRSFSPIARPLRRTTSVIVGAAEISGAQKQIPNRFARWIVVLGRSCSWVVLDE